MGREPSLRLNSRWTLARIRARPRRYVLATAPLDGIRIEVPHSSSPEEVAQQLRAFAEDLAQNKFSAWGVQVQPQGDGSLKLVGDSGGTHFVAEVAASDSSVVLTLSGQIQISRIKLTLAGGPEGLRRRVSDGISQVLQKHLE